MNPERDPSIGMPDAETEKAKKIKLIEQQLMNEGLSQDQKEKMIAELQELENLDDTH